MNNGLASSASPLSAARMHPVDEVFLQNKEKSLTVTFAEYLFVIQVLYNDLGHKTGFAKETKYMVESKLNRESLETFAASFSKEVCNSFFGQKSVISGKEIVEVTPVKQVNYFVLKILFRTWQKETLRLQSPYFNYRSEDVRKALFTFMNVLSQQISVSREHFEPLLVQSTKESILLMISPYDFFQEELTGHESGKLNDKYLKNSDKYIKVNKHIFEAYKESFDNKATAELSHADALTLLDELFEHTDLAPEEITEYEHQFNQVLGVDFQSFWNAEPAELADGVVSDGHPDEVIIEEDDEEDDDPQEEAEEDEEDERTVEDDEDEDELTVEDEVREEEQDQVAPEPKYDTLEELESFPEPLRRDEEERGGFEFLGENDDDEKGSALNNSFASSKTPLYEKLKTEQKPTLAELHQSQKIESIVKSITVNQRYMFVNELFSGNNDLFLEAMSKVEGCETFDDAVELMIHSYSRQLEWDMNAPEVKELLKMIFKKFR